MWEKFGRMSRRVLLATWTDRMIPDYYSVLVIESSINKHFNCIHSWARLVFRIEIKLKCGRPEETEKVLCSTLGRTNILEQNIPGENVKTIQKPLTCSSFLKCVDKLAFNRKHKRSAWLLWSVKEKIQNKLMGAPQSQEPSFVCPEHSLGSPLHSFLRGSVTWGHSLAGTYRLLGVRCLSSHDIIFSTCIHCTHDFASRGHGL